ncbi:MAG: succinate dehydrogenase cytochrome b subunit [Myxococcales bacterium]|nr:succinate dehydrogenase cytochrome b subunit [Myxococcales bacterium]
MTRFLSSSLGKKVVMSLTGFALVGFLVMHLAGNLTLYADGDGHKFVAYAHGLHDLGPLLIVGELGLAALFFVHIAMALRLTVENKAARPQGYAVRKTFGRSTLASRSMHLSGAVVLLFLLFHLWHLRFSEGIAAPAAESLLEKVKDQKTGLPSGLYAAVYLLGALAVGIHLSHGFKSAFQSLGANHPRLNRIALRVGLLLAVVLGVGFASFPIVAILSWRF